MHTTEGSKEGMSEDELGTSMTKSSSMNLEEEEEAAA